MESQILWIESILCVVKPFYSQKENHNVCEMLILVIWGNVKEMLKLKGDFPL